MAKPSPVLPSEAMPVQIRAVWGAASELPVEFADHVHVQRIGDRYFLTIGQSNFPLFEGQPTAPVDIPIRPLHRYAVSEADFRRIVGVLSGTVPPSQEAP